MVRDAATPVKPSPGAISLPERDYGEILAAAFGERLELADVNDGCRSF
jgi:hypothetical protein